MIVHAVSPIKLEQLWRSASITGSPARRRSVWGNCNRMSGGMDVSSGCIHDCRGQDVERAHKGRHKVALGKVVDLKGRTDLLDAPLFITTRGLKERALLPDRG